MSTERDEGHSLHPWHIVVSALFEVEKEIMMPENKEEQSATVYVPQDHPWIEMPSDDPVDEEIRYSLDEIRIG